MDNEVRIGGQITAEDQRIPKHGIPILAVYYDPKAERFCFLGYAALTTLLRSGALLEEYLQAKIASVRKLLVGVH